jgi:hypothetical protein
MFVRTMYIVYSALFIQHFSVNWTTGSLTCIWPPWPDTTSATPSPRVFFHQPFNKIDRCCEC